MITFCKDGLMAMLGDGVHTLFCNADEALAWSKTDRLDVAIAELSDIAQELCITLSADGAQAVTRKVLGGLQAKSWSRWTPTALVISLLVLVLLLGCRARPH